MDCFGAHAIEKSSDLTQSEVNVLAGKIRQYHREHGVWLARIFKNDRGLFCFDIHYDRQEEFRALWHDVRALLNYQRAQKTEVKKRWVQDPNNARYGRVGMDDNQWLYTSMSEEDIAGMM